MDDKTEAFKKPATTVPAKRAFETWAQEKKTEAWKLAAVKALRSWPIGAEVSESDYDQALDEACNNVIR